MNLKLSLIFVLSALASSAFAQTHLTNEHVDLNIGFTNPSTWSMQVRDDDNGITYTPSQAVLEVGAAALGARPSSSAFDFIGVGAGASYYRLPQSQNPNLLYLGVAAYDIGSTTFDSYNASSESGGRVNGTGRWVRLTLASVTGAGGSAAPGHFSVWQSGDEGPNVFMSSFSGGVTTNDSLWAVTGGHSHYNWGFSAPGTYEVSFRPSAYRGGSLVQSPDLFKIVFSVPSTVVPEPLSVSLLVSGLLGLALGGTRKRH